MSNKMFQSIIFQMRNAIDRTIGIVDADGVIIACSELQKMGETRPFVREKLFNVNEPIQINGYTYKLISADDKNSPAIFVEGEDDIANKSVRLISVSLSSIKGLYDEKHDKASFIKNIMLDNILPSDIYIKSKELSFANEESHIVMMIRFIARGDLSPMEMVQSMFPESGGDFVISIGEQDVVLVKAASPDLETEDYEQMAQEIADNINAEFYSKVYIGISSVAENLKDLARAYKEARISLEVGKVFDTEKNILCYESLGIGRLIYQLPTTLCEVFLQQVFKKGSLESLDQDTLSTVQSFFNNSLNVSETSRVLFVHRNTLVYRLEKIRKITGLDLRKFDHAVTFKVALMVRKYLTNKPTKF